MVRAKVEGNLQEQVSLFTPAPLRDGLMMADNAVDLSEGNFVVLIVQNHSTMPVRMKKCVLG